MTTTATTKDFIALEEQYGAHNYHPLDIVIERGEGAWVYDVEGNRYMDCLSAYSAVNQGHCHPKILKTLKEQADKVTLTSRAFRNDQLPLFYKELVAFCNGISAAQNSTPHPNPLPNGEGVFDMALPMNSGAEAVETAVKTARKWGYKVKGIPENQAEIIVCENNFHGRTTTLISFSTEPQYRDGFGPYTPGFKIIPFGDIDALKKAITPNTCAFITEPIQAEAGILIPPDGYLKAAKELCKQNNVLLILDEIQTGLGRTGKRFASDYDNAQPDMVVLGKALSGGFYPVSAVVSRKDILGVFHPGDHGSTFGGNPLACAIARTALKVLEEENLVENSAKLGAYFTQKLQSIQSKHIKEVRGRGLLIGIELNTKARPFCETLKAKGLLCKETHDNVIRLAPPLIVSESDLDWAFEHLKNVLGA